MSNLFSKHFFSTLSQDHQALLLAVNDTALISETDEKGTITFANDKFVEIAKYSREELIGQNHRILKSGHQDQTLFIDLWKCISSGKTWRGEIKNRAKDGSYYWVDTSIAPIVGSSGKPERYISMRFLITDKKEAEISLTRQNKELEDAKQTLLTTLEEAKREKKKAEELAHELVKFKVALDGTSDHVVITDSNAIVLYANAGLTRVTGFTPEEVLGKKAGTRESWGGNMSQEFYEKMWHTIKVDKKSFVGEITNKRKDGTIYQALSTISPLLNEAGNLEFFIGIERDITKEKEIDKAKTEFVSLASHQLRTPLTAIRWVAEMLEKKESLSEKGKQYLKDIVLSADRLSKLVDSLLNVSRIDEGRVLIAPEPVELVALIRSYLLECEPLSVVKNLKIIFQEHPPTCMVTTDPSAFRNILQAIFSNAIEYTPEGGAITVSLRELKEDQTFTLIITDTGIGIPKDEQTKVFTKFARATNAQLVKADGSGLGMYISWQAAKLLGGSIRFESKENEGTTFYVTLPVVTKGEPITDGKEGRPLLMT